MSRQNASPKSSSTLGGTRIGKLGGDSTPPFPIAAGARYCWTAFAMCSLSPETTAFEPRLATRNTQRASLAHLRCLACINLNWAGNRSCINLRRVGRSRMGDRPHPPPSLACSGNPFDCARRINPLRGFAQDDVLYDKHSTYEVSMSYPLAQPFGWVGLFCGSSYR